MSGWPKPTGNVFFENDDVFPLQSEGDKARRRALFAASRRNDTLSYYEVRSLPKDELVAMATVREENAEEDNNKTGQPGYGKTADSFGFDAGELQSVFMIPDDPKEEIERCQIERISTYGYLVDLQYHGETVVVPSRMVFESKDVARFMQQELIAYAIAPEMRH
jgi:hypothetical protein